jgi:hypothetical protein
MAAPLTIRVGNWPIFHPLANDPLQPPQVFVVARWHIRRLANADQRPLPILLHEEITIAGATRGGSIGREDCRGPILHSRVRGWEFQRSDLNAQLQALVLGKEVLEVLSRLNRGIVRVCGPAMDQVARADCAFHSGG